MMRKFAIRSVLLTLFMLAASAASSGQVAINITIAPPPLPVYVQPVCPGEGYIWTPGYWAWDPDAGDYYWVPGTWVLAPQVGFFWTPGYWGWGNGFYIWHVGYWGPVVGFYGGINYGFGYFGHGYYGGRWEGGHFFYNREVNNVNVTIIHNVYNEHVDLREVSHVSYNGGRGGINERPTPQEEAAERERHIAPVSDQVRHEQAARSNQELRAAYNHGKPPIAATARPGAFNEHEPAKEAGGPYTPPAKGETSRGASNAVHPKELPSLCIATSAGGHHNLAQPV
jgi:WXXGXW repeat (2 copies)